VIALALFALSGAGHPWLPGTAAIICGALAACFGFLAIGWGTAFAMAAILGGAGAIFARKLGLWWPAGLAPLAAIGLFIGISNHRQLALWLPPIFSALFVALGAAIAWAPHDRGAKLWQLNNVNWTLGLAVLLIAPLLALSLERDYRRRKRLASRTKQMEDDELQKRLTARKAAYERAFEQKNEG
jgi:membrane protein implicated in regulation of membrane protease activity